MSSFAENKQSSKNSSVLSIENLSSKNIIITKLKFDKNKKPSAIFLNVDGKSGCSFIFESPIMTVAFAAGYFGEKDNDKVVPEDQRNYSITFRPNGGNMDIPEESARFIEFLEDLKNIAVDFGIENSNQNIFKKKYEQSHREIMIENSFEYPFKPKTAPDGSTYPITVGIKVPKFKDTNLPDILCVTEHNKKIQQFELSSWDDLKIIAKEGTKCRAMLQPILSFINKKMYFTIRLKQLKVYVHDKSTIPKTYAFSDTPMSSDKTENNNSSENTYDMNDTFNGTNVHPDADIVIETDDEHHTDPQDVEVDTDN